MKTTCVKWVSRTNPVNQSAFLITLLRGLFVSCLLMASFAFAEPVPATRSDLEPQTEIHSLEDWLKTQGWWWMLKERSSPRATPLDGPTLSQRQRQALAQLKALERARKGETGPGATSLSTWTNIGPAHISNQFNTCFYAGYAAENAGRILALAVDPANSSHWLITASTGGIFETSDGGSSWNPRTDDQSSFNMASDSAAIAFAPGNSSIVYAGAFAAGLLKSTNGGTSWTVTETNVFGGRGAQAFLVSPADPMIVVAAVDTLYGANSSYGIYRTTDGGLHWTQKLSYAASALVSASFDKQYAAIGQIESPYNGSLYRSTNSGQNWQPVAGPWDGNARRIGLAFAPSNPSVLYVLAESRAQPFRPLGIWKSVNAWDPAPSWTPLATLPPDFGFSGFGHKLSVDPTNANDLYADGGHLYKYHNGVWADIMGCPPTGTHTDSWEIQWVLSTDGSSKDLVVTNDGGIFRSTDKGATYQSRNGDLPIAQFYPGSAIHPTSPNLALGGVQDNGTPIYGGSPTRVWQQYANGDGMASAISVVSPDTRWLASNQWLSIGRTTDGGLSWQSGMDFGIEQNCRPFVTHLASCPSADVVITGTCHLWRSDNAFTAQQPTWNLNNLDLGSDNPIGMTFARSDPTCGTYTVGAGGGKIWATTNGGTTWAQIGARSPLPTRSVTGLAFDPQDSRILYATFSGYNQDTPQTPGHVFVCNDITSPNPVWSNISPSVDTPHNAIDVDPGNGYFLAVGTDLGVLTSGNKGVNWAAVPANQIPRVITNTIKINRNTRKIVAFTYGRGAYSANLIDDTNGSSVQSGPAKVRSSGGKAAVPLPSWLWAFLGH